MRFNFSNGKNTKNSVRRACEWVAVKDENGRTIPFTYLIIFFSLKMKVVAYIDNSDLKSDFFCWGQNWFWFSELSWKLHNKSFLWMCYIIRVLNYRSEFLITKPTRCANFSNLTFRWLASWYIIIIKPTRWTNLTFRWPCIVVYSYNKTNKMH